MESNCTLNETDASVFQLTTLTNAYSPKQQKINKKSTFEPIDIDTGRFSEEENRDETKEDTINSDKPKTTEEICKENDKIYEKIYQEFVETGKLPKIDNFNDFKDYLFTLQVRAGVECDYDKAEKIGNDISTINKIMKERQLKEEQKKAADVNEFFMENTEFEHRNFLHLWDEKFNEVKNDFENRMNDLHGKHQTELNEFEQKWNDPSYLRTYSKVSRRILDLKAKEENCAKSKMWKEAKETSRRMRSLISSESRLKQRQAHDEMQKELTKLREKQAKEDKALKDKYNHKITVLRATKEAEEKPFYIRKSILIRKSSLGKENIQQNTTKHSICKPVSDDKPPPLLNIKPIGQLANRKDNRKRPKIAF